MWDYRRTHFIINVISKPGSDEQPFAKSKIGAKTAHGILKFRCGITVPPPCLALLYQEYISLNIEVQSASTEDLN